MLLAWAASAWAGCDAEAVKALGAALAAAPAEERLAMAAAGWGPLCDGDAGLDQQMAQIPAASPDARWLVELQTSLIDARRWHDACAGGTLALSMATKLGADQRRGHLWTACALERYAAFEQAEWSGATGLVVMPVLAAHTLTAGGISAACGRPIVRALAGL
ncbi:MAG: hypothetical protein R3F59_22540 [Myxococcota bacterium]